MTPLILSPFFYQKVQFLKILEQFQLLLIHAEAKKRKKIKGVDGQKYVLTHQQL